MKHSQCIQINIFYSYGFHIHIKDANELKWKKSLKSSNVMSTKYGVHFIKTRVSFGSKKLVCYQESRGGGF